MQYLGKKKCLEKVVNLRIKVLNVSWLTNKNCMRGKMCSAYKVEVTIQDQLWFLEIVVLSLRKKLF